MPKLVRSWAVCLGLVGLACSSNDPVSPSETGDPPDSAVVEDGGTDEGNDAGQQPRPDAGQDAGQDAGPDTDLTPPPCSGDDCLPELPELQNVKATVRGSTLLVEFSPVDDARDYRIYRYPASGRVLVENDGSLVVRDAIYRCAGDRPRPWRDRDGINLKSLSLEGQTHGYMRTEEESLLGHVYLTPGDGRMPVYRLGNPNRNAAYTWPSYVAPPGIDFTGGDYVTSTAARDALLSEGWRDDGIAFYVPSDGTRMVHRYESEDTQAILFYVDGPEALARTGGSERFSILAEPGAGSVPLYRIFYALGADHDVLAPGGANRERVLSQGNVPVTTVSWPGMVDESITYVIEALDEGCPFPGGLIGAMAATGTDTSGRTAPTILLDDARIEATGEVFINGQHAPENRPKPVARSFVTAAPAAQPDMDWFASFDQAMSPFETMYEDGNGVRVFHNDLLSIEYAGANVDYSFGAVLGQFIAGSSASFSLSARGANAKLADDDYLHVTMSVDIGSTGRRYPQIIITDAPLDPETFDLPVRPITMRLGPNTFEMLPPGDNHSIVVQTFGHAPELQVQFCDLRGWGVSDQCPRANVYGFHAGSELPDWTEPWRPVPVLGEYVGMDRPVKFDVYASTERVYVFVEDRPAGCAVLPADRFPAGDVNVVFGAAGYHIDIDEFVEPENSMHDFWGRHSLNHVERRMDDLGVDTGVALPVTWDESVLPCGERWYD